MQLPFEVNLQNKLAVVTGGSGVLGAVLCRALAKAGATVAVLARNQEKIDNVVQSIHEEGGKAIGFSVDVLDKDALEKVRATLLSDFGFCSILVNGAGGNSPAATTSQEFAAVKENDLDQKSFFDIDPTAVNELFNLNFLGTLLPTQVFAKDMINQTDCTVINVSSMNAFRPLTKIPAYSGAKAAVSNFTQWLAVHFSKLGIRVNAIAPGFFLTEQNKDLLIQEDGKMSERAEKITSQTPMERFGKPEELVGTLLWLVNTKASSFVNGVIVPIDGGFSAYSGV